VPGGGGVRGVGQAERLSTETGRRGASASCERCPRGRFGDKRGGVASLEQCSLCPAGRFGTVPGAGSAEDGCELSAFSLR